MRIFVINLDRQPERLASVDRQLKGQGLAYERVPAVFGKALSKGQCDSYVNRFRWWCAIGQSVLLGEIGCACSHYGLYRRMVEEKIPWAVVLEDDVKLEPFFHERLLAVSKAIQLERPQVFLFTNHTGESVVERGIRKISGDEYAECYAITRTAARVLLRANWPLQVPIDHWRRWTARGQIELFQVSPASCSQLQSVFGSDIRPGGGPLVDDMSLHRYIIHKGKRAIGLLLDHLIWRLFHR